jgi:DNA-directed RNA polymerase subunit K/omega
MPKKVKSKKIETEDEPDDEIEEESEIEPEEEAIEDTDDLSVNDEDEEEIEESDNDEDCLIEKTINEDNQLFDNIYNSEEQPVNKEVIVAKENRITINRLTKYEMVRILGERTKQLTMGAKPLVKNYNNLSYEKIAEEELKLNMIPYKIKRPLPNGKFEIWTLDELYKITLGTGKENGPVDVDPPPPIALEAV